MGIGYVAALIVAYLVGAVSFPYLIGRAYGVDLHTAGSRKLGGSNLAKTAGIAPGVAGGLLDAVKAFAAVLVARALGLPLETQLLAGLAAVVGQMWPVFHRFDGGRANATGWGFALAVDPMNALVMGGPIYLAVAANAVVRPRPTRVLPAASLLSFAILPAVLRWQERPAATVVAALTLFALIVGRRLTAGIRDDLATGAPLARILANRFLFDRSELQRRGLVAI